MAFSPILSLLGKSALSFITYLPQRGTESTDCSYCCNPCGDVTNLNAHHLPSAAHCPAFLVPVMISTAATPGRHVSTALPYPQKISLCPVLPVVDELHSLVIRSCCSIPKLAVTCVFGSRQFSSSHVVSGAHVPAMCPAARTLFGYRSASTILAAGGCVTGDSILTLEGFKWFSTKDYISEDGSDGWCVRDAFCQLLGWKPGSENWARFIKGPTGLDTLRLAIHLGLTPFEVVPEYWTELYRRCSHPGVALFSFPTHGKSHIEYVSDVRWLLRYWPTPDGLPSRWPPCNTGWPLGPEHMKRRPVLGAVIVDQWQPPRPAVLANRGAWS